MFYGFKPPSEDEVVFKVSGDLEPLRFLDHAARNILSGAVESKMKDGLRHQYAEVMESVAGGVASFVARCQRTVWLKPLGWILMPLAFVLVKLSIRATNADFNKREFVRDADGNYTLMFRSPAAEHQVRAAAGQLGVRIISERFPARSYRQPKPDRNPGSSFTFTMTVNGKTITLDLLG